MHELYLFPASHIYLEYIIMNTINAMFFFSGPMKLLDKYTLLADLVNVNKNLWTTCLSNHLRWFPNIRKF